MQNQQLAAQGATRIQELQAQAAQRRQELVGSGEQYILGLSEQRDAGELAGLGNLYAGAQQSANAALQAKATSRAGIIGGLTSAAGAIGGGLIAKAGSDVRLKENITRVGTSPSGIPIHQFNYKGMPDRFEGVLSKNAPEAVIKNFIGQYDGVDYSKVDVELKKIK